MITVAGAAVGGLAVVLSVLVLYAAVSLAKVRWAMPAVLTGFGVHLTIGVVLYLSAGLVAPDASQYDGYGLQFARWMQGISERPPAFTSGKQGYVWLAGFVYWLIGHHPMVMIVINCLFTGIIVVVVARAAAVRPQNRARRAAWLAALFPSQLLWSSLLLREAMAALCILVIITAALYARRRWSAAAGLSWLAAVAVLYVVRGPVAVIVSGATVLGYLASGAAQGRRSHPARRAVLLGVVVVALATSGTSLLGLAGTDVEQVSVSRTSLARSSSSTFGNVGSLSSSTDLFRSTLVQLPRAALGPLPWEWSLSPVGAITALDGVVWVALLVATFVGIRRSKPTDAMIVMLPVAALVAAIALTSGNYGTLVRIRAEIVYVLLPLATVRPRTPDEEPTDLGPDVGTAAEGRMVRS